MADFGFRLRNTGPALKGIFKSGGWGLEKILFCENYILAETEGCIFAYVDVRADFN